MKDRKQLIAVHFMWLSGLL